MRNKCRLAISRNIRFFKNCSMKNNESQLLTILSENKTMFHFATMKKYHLLLAFIMLVSCNSNRNIIVPFDYIKNFPDTKNGLTQEQANEYMSYAMNQIQLNTVGKKVPKIFIYDIHNKKVKLNSLINQTTFLYATDKHCGFGMEVLDTDLPHALEKLKEDSIYIYTIALLVKTDFDSTNMEDFNNTASEINLMYDHFYIIDESESKKLNALNAAKILIDKNKNIISIGFGASLDPNGIYEQLKSRLMLWNEQNASPAKPKIAPQTRHLHRQGLE